MAHFQHRHYKAIAAIISQFPDSIRPLMIREFSDAFMRDNYRFDVGRFESACNGAPTTKKDRVKK